MNVRVQAFALFPPWDFFDVVGAFRRLGSFSLARLVVALATRRPNRSDRRDVEILRRLLLHEPIDMVLAGTVPTSHGSEMKNPRNGDAGGVMLLCENGKLRHTYDQLLHGAGEMKKGKRGLFIDNSEKPLSLHEENVYLKEMIKWEQARTMKIGARVADFVPLISLAMATDAEVERALPKLVKALTLAGHNIVCAEHLSDRRLYSLIVNGVLPFQAKVLPKGMFTEWFCCFHSETTALDPDDFSIYFQYYAEDFERDFWNRDEAVPTKIATPYPRPYLPKHRPIFSL